jgi:hypothetical protein
MINLQKIYEEIKSYYESQGVEIDEFKLRQMAWMKRDRMIYESSLGNSAASSSAGAGSGGGSTIARRFPQSDTNILLTESGEPLQTENGENINL